MSAPAKKASGWGSFLQQAVAGVESRLDNILAEGAPGEEGTKAPPPSKVATPVPAGTPAKLESGMVYTGTGANGEG